MLRRSYDTVKGSFPELIPPQLVWLDPSYEQLAIHDNLKQITNKMLEAFNEGKETMVSIIGTFSLMLQVADTPELLKFSSSELGKKLFKKYFKDLKHIYSPKIEWVSDFIEERKINDLNAKTLLFTRSDDMAFLIKEELLQFYPECDIITFTGALSEAERDVCKKSFLNPSGAKVFISTDAGSEGLNLQVTDVEINIDLPFNPSRLAQRVGRLHRKGSTFSHVRVINLITKESIDERILDIIYQKQKLVDEVIEGNVVDVEMSSNLLKKLLAN
jgi:SNF2 family DNA or RNA helicase